MHLNQELYKCYLFLVLLEIPLLGSLSIWSSFFICMQSCFGHFPPINHYAISVLERACSFKYLRLILNPIGLGLIYHHFYKQCSSHTLLILYCTLVWLILEYNSALWDPPFPVHWRYPSFCPETSLKIMVTRLLFTPLRTQTSYSQTQTKKN